MTTSNLLLIRAALEARLRTVVPDIPTVYENVAYDPNVGTPHQRIYHLVAEPDAPTIDSAHRLQGFMQVSLFYPLLLGAGPALEQGTLIANKFTKGMELVNGSMHATITRPTYVGSGTRVDDAWMVPVKVFWNSNFIFQT